MLLQVIRYGRDCTTNLHITHISRIGLNISLEKGMRQFLIEFKAK